MLPIVGLSILLVYVQGYVIVRLTDSSVCGQVCTGAGPEECRMVQETFCSTRYKEQAGGRHLGDTRCEKVGHLVCGKGCSYTEEKQICHEDRIGTGWRRKTYSKNAQSV